MKLIQIAETAWAVAKNAVLGGNVISLLLAAKPRKLANYLSESMFLYKALNAARGLPEKNVFLVLPAQNVETIRLGNLNTSRTYFHATASYAADIVNLCLICQIIKPKVVFEIGTLDGYTAFHLALNTPEDAVIYTLDLPTSAASTAALRTTFIDDAHIHIHSTVERYCFQGSPVADKIVTLFGDSATFDFSPFHGKVDFFFIDGAHSVEYARSDTLNALRCCHPQSVIAWHDFGRAGVNGVSKVLTDLAREREIYATPGGSLAYTVVN